MVRARVLAAMAALAALPGCSLLLDFSEPIPDAASVDPDANDTCEADEPNDTPDTATSASRGTTRSSLCPATDLDYYGFTLADGADLIATLTFDGGAHDLTLTLLSAGNPITISNGTTGEERIERSASLGNTLPAGDYELEVSAVTVAGEAAPYDLDISGI